METLHNAITRFFFLASLVTATLSFAQTRTDVTNDYIKNAACSSLEGWNYWGTDDWGGWHTMSTQYTGINAQLNVFIERWVSRTTTLQDGVLSQTIENLPNGVYSIEADILACQQGYNSTGSETGTYLFAASGSYRDSINTCTQNGVPKHFSVVLSVENNSLTIGFETINSQMNWAAVDNWKLYVIDGLEGIAQEPQISINGNMVTITTTTVGATIYYTIDGTTPTTNSTIYTEPFEINKPCTIKAVASGDHLLTSQVASKTIFYGVSANTPADLSSFIVNPSFDNDDVSTGWKGTPFGSVSHKENAEHYYKNYDTYQTISGLPTGVYAVGVKAFYRPGDAQSAYDNYKAQTEASKYAKL